MLSLALAAAAAFATPLADAELASAVADVRPQWTAPPDLYGLRTSVAQELVDDWWAEDGAALIAAAVQPRVAFPAGLETGALRLGIITVHYTASTSAF